MGALSGPVPITLTFAAQHARRGVVPVVWWAGDRARRHGSTNKRDCDTARGLYGRGALYWSSPPGTVTIEAARWSIGREIDTQEGAPSGPPGR